MIAFSPSDFSRLLPLLRTAPINVYFAEAVLRGQVRGFVWVDDPRDPRAFLIAHACGLSLLGGETDDPRFLAGLRDYLTNAGGFRTRPEFLQAFPAGWHAKLPALLGDVFLSAATLRARHVADADLKSLIRERVVEQGRCNFRFDRERFRARRGLPLPAGFRISRLGADGFAPWPDMAVPPAEFWNDAEDFARRSVAFAVMHEAKPVCLAFAALVLEDVIEIGIETRAEFRGRGFAWHACAAFIGHALERGLEPVWACRSGNLGSRRTAESLGFVPTVETPYYGLVIRAGG